MVVGAAGHRLRTSPPRGRRSQYGHRADQGELVVVDPERRHVARASVGATPNCWKVPPRRTRVTASSIAATTPVQSITTSQPAGRVRRSVGTAATSSMPTSRAASLPARFRSTTVDRWQRPPGAPAAPSSAPSFRPRRSVVLAEPARQQVVAADRARQGFDQCGAAPGRHIRADDGRSRTGASTNSAVDPSVRATPDPFQFSHRLDAPDSRRSCTPRRSASGRPTTRSPG